MRIKKSVLFQTPYRVSRVRAAAVEQQPESGNGQQRYYVSNVNDDEEKSKMNEFVPTSYRAFLKRLPAEKQHHNKYLDANFEVKNRDSISDSDILNERPLFISIKAKTNERLQSFPK